MDDRLKVALSVDALGPQLTGIGRYCLELARRLPANNTIADISYFRGPHWLDDPMDLLDANWKPARMKRWRRSLRDWRRQRAVRNAIVHAPNYFLPHWAERGVATVHDLSVFHFPETHPAERVKAFATNFDRTLQQAALFITDSQTVRQELIDMFGVAPDRVTAIPLGAGVAVIDEQHGVAALQRHGLQAGSYFLCVSTLEPRKQIECLLAAHAALAPDLRRRFPLVLVGASGWQNDALNAGIDAAVAQGHVRRLGFVDEADLGAIYAGATAFAYPSRYEGFGLPVVEAMARGIPCIISNAACLVEVAQGAAKVVDPHDVSAFAAALAEAAEDGPWRREAAVRGRDVAAGYSWENCVNNTAAAYHRVARG